MTSVTPIRRKRYAVPLKLVNIDEDWFRVIPSLHKVYYLTIRQRGRVVYEQMVDEGEILPPKTQTVNGIAKN